MTQRRFDDQQAAALLARFDSGETKVDALAREFGCSWQTIQLTLERAREARDLAQQPSPPPPAPLIVERQCEYCRGHCQNVMACGRRRRADAQRPRTAV